jgi:peptidoglycan hydrolase-like protein with peptidoglycan-binding domain
MRLIVAVVVLVAAALPALSQTAAPDAPKPVAPAAKPAPKPAASPAAKPPAAGSPRVVFEALAPNDRMALQSDLAWSNDYNGVIDGSYSDRLIAAIKAFQKRNAGKETGIFNPQERALLAASVKSKQDNVGWKFVADQATGARLGLPTKLVPQSTTGKSGSHWQSSRGEAQVDTFRVATQGTTIAAVFDEQKKEANRKVEYSVLRPDTFVISGLQGLKKFYIRAQANGSDVRGVVILYDQAMEGIMDPVVVAMSSAYSAFPSDGQALAPARRKIDYGTGIIVTGEGHIVTDRQVTDECQTIVVPGFGNAERIAEDKVSDIALLRIYGARDLKPLPLMTEGPRGTDAMVVGIPDPQVQGGAANIATIAAHLTPARTFEPAPSLGYSGAPALDGTRFAGMVGLKPQQAAFVSAEAIKTFLYTYSVAPESGAASLDAAKAAVVRVICVRK